MNPAMKRHALGILNNYVKQHESRLGVTGRDMLLSSKILSNAIIQSTAIGGTLLEHFWDRVRQCHPKFKENVDALQQTEAVSEDISSRILLDGVDQAKLNLKPIYDLAAETFTYLGLAVRNRGCRAPDGLIQRFSDSDSALNREKALHYAEKTTDRLLRIAQVHNEPMQQLALQNLVIRRDGDVQCPISARLFDPRSSGVLTQIIPKTVLDNSNVLKYLTMFAGPTTANIILHGLSSLENLINIQLGTLVGFDKLSFAIESLKENGKIKYILRDPFPVPDNPLWTEYVLPNLLNDGDEIAFGRGPEGARLGPGPHPRLCNLRLAIMRVFQDSGAMPVMADLEEGANNRYVNCFPRDLLSPHFCDVLSRTLMAGHGEVTYGSLFWEAIRE
ncbi:hypothetical protein Hypma_004791 [Hypsizygus marmoreus]|uniref:Uncharacterized protein n=1 Tax=Hypsizygus marmoreus TaxID=39966 RepID=A0A369IZU4_HYPMA|nr:hypothetical protein Hypma_004791 [Hypsizygus marmoreus]